MPGATQAVGGSVGGLNAGGNSVTGTGGRAPPGIGSMTTLGGSLQSFLGEAGMGYAESTSSGGGDSFKDGFTGEGGAGGGNGGGSSSSMSGGHNAAGRQFGGEDNRGTGLRDSPCKMEAMDEDEDGCGDSELDEEHDYEHQGPPDPQDPQELELQGGEGGGGEDDLAAFRASSHGQSSEQGVRGLGRVFGIHGTHPMIADAQARAEATVHGRGGRGSGSGSAAEAAEKKRKRAVLSKEERAKQNRDRNREHARNTRLRKKAFVEELKNKVGGFCGDLFSRLYSRHHRSNIQYSAHR